MHLEEIAQIAAKESYGVLMIKRRETLINYIAWRKEKLDNLASPQTTAYEYDL